MSETLPDEIGLLLLSIAPLGKSIDNGLCGLPNQVFVPTPLVNDLGIAELYDTWLTIGLEPWIT